MRTICVRRICLKRDTEIIKNLRSEAVEGKMEHEGMEVYGGALVGSLAKVGEHLLSLDDKDVASVLAESADVENLSSHFTLPLPGRSVRSEDTFLLA